MSKPPDRKGSKFKPLRGVNTKDVMRLLKELQESEITVNELTTECNSLKMLGKVQAAFIKGTNCDSLEQALQKFPSFCTSQQLEPFIKQNVSKKTLPSHFLAFCQRAMTSETSSQGSTCTLLLCDDILCANDGKSAVSIFWKKSCVEMNPNSITDVFKQVQQEFRGFPLTIFDISDDEVSDEFTQHNYTMYFIFSLKLCRICL